MWLFREIAIGFLCASALLGILSALDIGGSNGSYINATIDEMRIYNRSISATEIQLLYQSEFSRYNSSQYRFYANITNLTEGIYTYYAWVNDTSGQFAYTTNYTESSPRYLYIDLSAPTLILLTLNDTSPVRAGNVTFTLDFSEAMNTSLAPTVQIKNSSTYTINTIGWNNSTRWVGWYNFTTSTGDGNYTVNITGAKDTSGNTMTANTSNTFLLDTTNPSMTITSPTNTTYGVTSIDLNYTASDTYLSSCWYSLDSAANQTLTNCQNTTLTSLSDGNHTIIVYANDTAGNIGSAMAQFNVSTLDIYLNKSFSPDTLIAYEIEQVNVTTRLKINKTSYSVTKINFTDEVPWDFALYNSTIKLVFQKYSPFSETDVTSNVTITVRDLPGQNNTIIEINCSNTSVCFGSYMAENDTLILTYMMNSSALNETQNRSTITFGNATDTNLISKNRTLNSTISVSEIVLRGYKDITVNLANPQNLSSHIVVTAIGGTLGDIELSDYLPEGAYIYNLTVRWYNGSINQTLTNVSDFSYTVSDVTLPGGWQGEVYLYDFTAAGVTWPGHLHNNESIYIDYNFTVLGGGAWDLPAIISGFDPTYNRTVKTEMYANANVPSFDVILQMITREVQAGDLAKALLKILNVGGPRAKVDVYSSYSIKDKDGNMINDGSETIAVVDTKEMMLELEVPKKTPPGRYYFEAYVSYVGREALSTKTFEIVGEENADIVHQYGLYIFVGILMLIILALLVRRSRT